MTRENAILINQVLSRLTFAEESLERITESITSIGGRDSTHTFDSITNILRANLNFPEYLKLVDTYLNATQRRYKEQVQQLEIEFNNL